MSLTAAWARIRCAPGWRSASVTVFAPKAGMPRPAWIRTGTRRSFASETSSSTAGSSMVNCSARGCSLIPRAPASRQRLASARAIVVRIDPAEGDQAAGGARGGGQRLVVGRRVAAGLVHREGDGARSGRLDRRQQLLGSCR